MHMSMWTSDFMKRVVSLPQPLVSRDDEADQEADRVEKKRISENYFVRAQTLSAWLLATSLR